MANTSYQNTKGKYTLLIWYLLRCLNLFVIKSSGSIAFNPSSSSRFPKSSADQTPGPG